MTNADVVANPTPSDLDECATMTVADALKIILADSYAIYLKTKNFHWHVSGPYFRDYHLLLDEQAAQILAVTDAIAERARKTGNTTIRSIGDIARHQTIRDNHGRVASPCQGRRGRRQRQCDVRPDRYLDRRGGTPCMVPLRGQSLGPRSMLRPMLLCRLRHEDR
jgi:hypothetical protein